MIERGACIIRFGATKDASTLAEIGARTFYDTFAANNTPEDMSAYIAESFGEAVQYQELSDPETRFLIAEIDGVMAGYAKLQLDAYTSCSNGLNQVELARLYVVQGLIGKGVGAALMEKCITEMPQAGFETMWLGVWEQNIRAKQFYEKWGFRVIGEQTFQLGADLQRDLVMERTL